MRAFIALALQHLRANRLAVMVWSAVAGLMSWAIARSAPAMTDERFIRGFLAALPRQLLKILGDPGIYRNAVDYFISYKWLQAVPLLGGIFGVTAAMGIIAHEIDRRTADFPLSLPVARAFFLGARFAAVGLGLFLLYLTAFAVLWGSMASMGLPGSFGGYAMHFMGSYGVALAYAAGALCLGMTGRAYGPSLRIAVFVTTGSFLLSLVNRIVGGPAFLGWFLLYDLADTRATVGRGIFPAAAVVAGLAATAVLLALSMKIFSRKEIPA